MHRGALDLGAPTRDRHWEMRSNLLGTQKRMQELAPEVDCLLDATGRGNHAADARIGVGKKKRLGGEPKRLVDQKCRGVHGTLDGKPRQTPAASTWGAG